VQWVYDCTIMLQCCVPAGVLEARIRLSVRQIRSLHNAYVCICTCMYVCISTAMACASRRAGRRIRLSVRRKRNLHNAYVCIYTVYARECVRACVY
jgi:hypothetical protein